MTSPGSIGLEGEKFVLSDTDLNKLKTEDGCTLADINDKIHNLDDDSLSSEDEGVFDDISRQTQASKAERSKREFLAIALNVNKDPVKPGEDYDFTKTEKLLETSDETEEGILNAEKFANHSFCDFLTRENRCDLILKRYSHYKGNYEKIIQNQENPFTEVLEGRVFKRRLYPGVGKVVDVNSTVVYNCSLWTDKSSDPFDSTWLRQNAHVADLANDSILPGIFELLLTMRKNEWCEAFLRPEAAFGRLGCPPRIPANSTIFCLIEMVKVFPNDNISLLARNADRCHELGIEFDELYAAANQARVRGNYYFEQKDYKAAIQRYKSGIRILEGLTYKDEKEEKKSSTLLVKLYNNCARTANASGEVRLALAACKQANLIDPMCPKTHWQKMMAWKKKGHLDRALGVARHALQLFPEKTTSNSFNREILELKKRLETERIETNELHRLMGRALVS